MRADATVLESCDISSSTVKSARHAANNNYNNHHNHVNLNKSTNLSDMRSCPHHILLSDGEWGPDRNIQIRPQYQVMSSIQKKLC